MLLHHAYLGMQVKERPAKPRALPAASSQSRPFQLGAASACFGRDAPWKADLRLDIRQLPPTFTHVSYNACNMASKAVAKVAAGGAMKVSTVSQSCCCRSNVPRQFSPKYRQLTGAPLRFP